MVLLDCRQSRSLAATVTTAYQRSAFASWLACVGCWIRGVAVGEPGRVQVSRCSGERSDKVGSREIDSEAKTGNRLWFDLIDLQSWTNGCVVWGQFNRTFTNPSTGPW